MLDAFDVAAHGHTAAAKHLRETHDTTAWWAQTLTVRYEQERIAEPGPMVAYQMNWKGENFYTGNRVYVFAETDNKRIKKWFGENEGRRVYVLMEHKRLARFERLFLTDVHRRTHADVPWSPTWISTRTSSPRSGPRRRKPRTPSRPCTSPIASSSGSSGPTRSRTSGTTSCGWPSSSSTPAAT